jgi:hypothetical protein
MGVSPHVLVLEHSAALNCEVESRENLVEQAEFLLGFTGLQLIVGFNRAKHDDAAWDLAAKQTVANVARELFRHILRDQGVEEVAVLIAHEPSPFRQCKLLSCTLLLDLAEVCETEPDE